MATTQQQSMIVGIFQNDADAEKAVTQLKQAGFDRDQIEFAHHGGSTGGGALSGLKRLFTGKGETASDVYNDLTGMGVPEQDARNYQREYEIGRSIVAVTGNSRLEEAKTIFATNGAYGGANRQTTQATSGTTRTADSVEGTPTTAANEQAIQLREEQLQVYKRPVQTGEVRLGKNVVSEQQTLNVPVTHEEVVINRQPVSGQVSDTPIGEDETIRVPVSEDRVNVTKQTMATEEVGIGKRQVQENQQVTDTVLKEKAQIERQGDVPVHGTRTDSSAPGNKSADDLLDE